MVSFKNLLTLRIVSFGLIAVSLTVVVDAVTDPVNVTKLFVLGGFSFAAIGSCASRSSLKMILRNKIAILGILFFLFCSLITLVFSTGPITQKFYGVYGRNNGFLLYLLLVLLFISILANDVNQNFKSIIFALFVAGFVNLIYMLWFTFFGDIFPWYNQYKNFLGTFGNPNFISSFFGIFCALVCSYIFDFRLKKSHRVGLLMLLPIIVFGITKTDSLQGFLVSIVAIAVVFFFYARSKFGTRIQVILLTIGVIGFGIALLGILQKGPLAPLLYQRTISLRGQYWYAAWKAGTENPWVGVGFDGFGDWYRRLRRESALEFPGLDTVTNAAHNVYLDMLAFGGWPLFVAYVFLVLIVINSILRFTLNNKKFDPIFVALSTSWIAYQLQSVVSINQIGLAVWGWALGAAVIAYENNSRFVRKMETLSTKSSKSRISNHSLAPNKVIGPSLISGLMCLVGFFIATPPLAADSSWRAAQLSQSPQVLERSMHGSFMNPLNSFKLNSAVGVYEINGFHKEARKLALIAVKFNPDNFEAWRNLYQLKDSSLQEKANALANMKRLDPMNPSIGSKN